MPARMFGDAQRHIWSRAGFVAAALGVALLAGYAAGGPGAGELGGRAALAPSKPQSLGLAPQRLARIGDYLRAEVAAGRLPGGVIGIARRGRLAHVEAVGMRDPETKAPMPVDAIFAIASMTKPMTSVAALILYEEGRLLLSDPVAKHLPRIGEMKIGQLDAQQKVTLVDVKPAMTVLDLLRHTSGIGYREQGAPAPLEIGLPAGVPSIQMERETFIATLARAPLRFQPGTQYLYGLSTDVLGLVVEKVAGKPLAEFLRERLWGPLGMVDTGFAIPPAKKGRQALPFDANPLTGKPIFVLHSKGETLKFDCGGACAVSTLADYLRFAEMLRNGGTLDGVRILGRKTVELMTANHLTEGIVAASVNPTLAQGHGFGLGVSPRVVGGANLSGSVGDFGWAGAWGTLFWIDPAEELSVVFMAQQPGELRAITRHMIKTLVMAAVAD